MNLIEVGTHSLLVESKGWSNSTHTSFHSPTTKFRILIQNRCQMPPVPCTNCLRFHYGTCHEAPKQCFECGGFNHIERYCPSKQRVTTTRGEPLPGSRRWCEMHGLDNDPELKRKILNALKVSPGSAIWVNDECIYRGNDRNFLSNSRGRALEDRVSRARARSRSPRREYPEQTRQRSPLRRYERSMSRERGQYGYRSGYQSPMYEYASRTRSRSPDWRRRRTPSPHRLSQPRPRSPRYASGSNAVVFEPPRDRMHENRPHVENRPQEFVLPAVNSHLPQPQPVPRYVAVPQDSFDIVQGRAPLGQVSNNIPRRDKCTESLPKLTTPATGASPSDPTPTSQSQPTPDQKVEDPHFVLGVKKGALESE